MIRTRSLRWLTLPALLALALLLFAACEDDGNGGETPAGGDTPAAEATADDQPSDGGGTPVDGETPDDGATDGATPDDGDDGDGADGGEATPAGGAGQTIVQMVTGRQFSPDEIFIAAGTDVTITTDNTDPGIPHSFAIYNTQQDADGGSDPLAEVDTCNGPCQDEVTVNLDGGTYFFRCEVHGSSMSGTLTAR
ncbi:MAG: cupredoxin domain-containing protein [Dehalococcoidia bacterium]